MIRTMFAFAFIIGCLPVTTAGQSKPMADISAPQRMVLSYFHDVLDRGKAELIEDLFLPDCVIHRPEGELKGLAGLRNMLQGRRANFGTLSTQVHEMFESGDRIVVRVTHKGEGAGPYRFRIGTHDVRGKTLIWDAIVIFRMQNGKIAEEWVSRDELGMLLSAGVLKAGGNTR